MGRAKHHKRTPEEIIHDRKIIWNLHNSHLSYGEIADFLNARGLGYTLSRSQVFKDVKAARKQAVDSLGIDKDEHIAQQLAKLDRMEMEAWTEWERSKEELVNVEQTKKINKQMQAGKQGEPSQLVTTSEKTNQKQIKKANLGMTKYMEVIKWCIQERNKLLALITTKIKQVSPDGDVEVTGAGGNDAQVVLMLPDNHRDKVAPPAKVKDKATPSTTRKKKTVTRKKKTDTNKPKTTKNVRNKTTTKKKN